MATDPLRTTPPELLVRLDAFEGPLDLLLELIRKHEIDVFDIPISFITEEYLRFVRSVETVDLEIGGEWLEMAALLIFIKSKMLLPKEEFPNDEDGPDPREELVERLLEYQRYKAAAQGLDSRAMLERDVFTHPEKSREFTSLLGPPPIKEASLSDLLEALERVVARRKVDGRWVYEVSSQQLTLRSVILEIADVLTNHPRIRFEDLFEHGDLSRHRIVTTFLALLEMTRLKMIKLFQSRLEGDQLWIERSIFDIDEVSQLLELHHE